MTSTDQRQSTSMGLLTTVAQLPPKYKIRYLARATMIESPLDLTVKQIELSQLANQKQSSNIFQLSNKQTIAQKELLLDQKLLLSNPTNAQLHQKPAIIHLIQSKNSSNQKAQDHNYQCQQPQKILLQQQQTTFPSSQTILSKGPTPALSPPKKRYRDGNFKNIGITNSDNHKVINTENEIIQVSKKPLVIPDTTSCGLIETVTSFQTKELTPKKPIKCNTAPRTTKTHPTNSSTKERKTKAIRKLKFDEYQSSPVSGTIIRPLEEINENDDHESGDIDPQYNIVEVTEEAKAELALIKNVIGSYTCKLCRQDFEDAFGLARHRCSCIVLLEYRCPECGKRFNCPANLASHRRWHKPKEEVLRKQRENSENEPQYPCSECGKQFKRQAYLRKHLATHNKNKNKNLKKSSSESSSSSKSDFIQFNSNSVMDDSQHSLPLSSASHSDSINYKENIIFRYDSDMESRASMCSSPGRLQIVENLTEEENIAATALANLGRKWNGPSVIHQHINGTTISY